MDALFADFKRTFARYSDADRDRTLLALARSASALEARWPRAVDFAGLLPSSEIALFPLFFVDAFGNVDDERLAHFLAGSRLLAGAVVIADRLFDDQLAGDERVGYLMRWQGVQFECERELARVFPVDSPFWPVLQANLAEYLGCVATEWSCASGRRALGDVTAGEARALALAKSSVSRVAIVGLREIGEDPSRADALLASLDRYNLARQLWDDVQDWRADVTANLPTLVTVRLAGSNAPRNGAWPAPDLTAHARSFYYDGLAHELLGEARAQLAAAVGIAGRPRLPWHALLEDLDARVALLRRDLDEIARRHLERRARPAVSQ